MEISVEEEVSAASTCSQQQHAMNTPAEISVEVGRQTSDGVHIALDAIEKHTKGTCIVLDNVGAKISRKRNSLSASCFAHFKKQHYSQGDDKELLQGVSGVIRSSDMCALMGPSGAGKTTLLDIIGRRKTEGKLSGKVLFDGYVPTITMVKQRTAYIQQQDIFFGGATVAETIAFAAMAKLPGNTISDNAAKMKRVEEVIQQMNLKRCQDTLIGNRMIRGVSGGELKRVAVACALLRSPQCMFLDEPTSGLDSAMAQEVVQNLKTLQMKQGCTLVVTIHQPSPSVYEMFNRLILLNEGHLVYLGPGRNQPLQYFADCGFPYQAGYNIAEYLIDLINQHHTSDKDVIDFASYYKDSNLSKQNDKDVEEMTSLKSTSEDKLDSLTSKPHGSKYVHTVLPELWILLKYKGIIRWKHPLFLCTRVGLYIMLSCLLATFYYGQTHSINGTLNIAGILFISTVLPLFMAQVFVEEMKLDREVYTREFNDAYYRAGTYVAHRIITEAPVACVAAVGFSIILYWSVGLNWNVLNWMFFTLVTTSNFIISMLVGFTISSAMPGELGPAICLPVFSTLNMLVGGFFIRKSTIHGIWIWLYWISFVQWNWSALMVNEFHGEAFSDHCNESGGTPLGGLFNELPLTLPPSSQEMLNLYFESRGGECSPFYGDSVLASFGLVGRSRWLSFAWASLSFPVFVATFYLGVRFVRHERR